MNLQIVTAMTKGVLSAKDASAAPRNHNPFPLVTVQ